jgi:hypothetical protein
MQGLESERIDAIADAARLHQERTAFTAEPARRDKPIPSSSVRQDNRVDLVIIPARRIAVE